MQLVPPRRQGAGLFIALESEFVMAIMGPARTTMEGKNVKRTFDWDECSKQHRPAHFTWLKANHDKPIEEAAYVAAYKSLRSSDNRPKNARRYATAKLKGSYRRLREDFGFFV